MDETNQEVVSLSDFFASVTQGSNLVTWINKEEGTLIFLTEGDRPNVNPHRWTRLTADQTNVS